MQNHEVPIRVFRKFFVSGFVILTFIAYALHERLLNPNTAAQALSSQGSNASQQPALSPKDDSPAAAPTDSPAAPPTDVPPTDAQIPTQAPAAFPPTSVPTATPASNGQYKNGTFTGSQVDAYWGVVQVKAIIRGGKISDVQFMQYPSDRRTSVRINNIAMPDLTQEAVQAQNANVDIISGATLTSEAFAQSLQAALDNAKN